jgi:hypothetical protein
VFMRRGRRLRGSPKPAEAASPTTAQIFLETTGIEIAVGTLHPTSYVTAKECKSSNLLNSGPAANLAESTNVSSEAVM